MRDEVHRVSCFVQLGVHQVEDTRGRASLLVPRIIWEVRFILPSSLCDFSSAIRIIYLLYTKLLLNSPVVRRRLL